MRYYVARTSLFPVSHILEMEDTHTSAAFAFGWNSCAHRLKTSTSRMLTHSARAFSDGTRALNKR